MAALWNDLDDAMLRKFHKEGLSVMTVGTYGGMKSSLIRLRPN